MNLQEDDAKDSARSVLDQLLSESKLYKTSTDYMALLDFVVRLRNFAPFNAMLLQIQKPGLTYAASASDWRIRFNRTIIADSRPLIVLRPFGPVALVYDVADTEGEPLPGNVFSYPTQGTMTGSRMKGFRAAIEATGIQWADVDAGDANAGKIQVIWRATKKEDRTKYLISINKNHADPVRFVTLLHELAHLYLSHLGADPELRVPERVVIDHKRREIEAESVAYLVARRNGVEPKSQTYLSGFVTHKTTVDDLDIYQIMRAAGQIEALLRLGTHAKPEKPVKPAKDSQGIAQKELFL